MGDPQSTNSQNTLPKPPPISNVSPVPLGPTPADNSGPVKAAPISVDEYTAKYVAAQVRPERLSELKNTCSKIMASMGQYNQVALATGVPAFIVGCIHEKEASLNFNTYLQNGDRLFNSAGVPIPTVDVPRGVGPFDPQTWVNAAIHALGGQGAHSGASQKLGYWLGWCEAYNGLGYRKRGIASPYIWSFTDQYTMGHYVSDGVFSPTAVDANPGVAALLKVLGGLP